MMLHTLKVILQFKPWSFILSRGGFSLTLLGGLLVVLTISALANGAGGLDTTFGTDGRVTTNFGGGDVGHAVAVQSNGKIVVAGGSSNAFATARYNSDGSPDTDFGTDGRVTASLGGAGWGMAIQSDGKIVVAGYSNSGSGDDFTVVRYNSDGSLDISFDVNGIVTTDFNSILDQAYAVATQSDGKIVVAGYSDNGNDYDFAIARYNNNGSLDPAFDTDGKVTTDFSGWDTGEAIAVQSDGKIVVVGHSDNGSDYDFAIARYNNNGSLDPAFDTDGKVTTDFNSGDDRGYAVAIQSDGKIVVAGYSTVVPGYSDFDFAVVRYNSDGSLDTSFGTDGRVASDFDSLDYGRAVAIQSSGKIVVAGWSDDEFAVVRYNSDGSLDANFGTNGRVTTDFDGGEDRGYAVAVQSDDKIVVAGGARNSHDHSMDFSAARYCGLAPDLTITKSASPSVAKPGQALTYTLVFGNAGDITATNILITDVVPSNVTSLSYSSNRPVTSTGSISYTWRIEDLAPTEGGMITITGVLSSGLSAGTFTNTAVIAGTAAETGVSSDTASARVTIANVAPIANDDTDATAEDTATTINVLANDTDVNSDTLSVDSVTQGNNGIALISGDTTVTYTPTLNFNGIDVFTYTVSDGSLTDTATVTVTVTPVNDPPDAVDDTATTVENTSVTIGVLGNDSDLESDPLTVTVVGASPNGSATTSGVTVTYTPTLNFNGTDVFTYTVSDGSLTDTATVTVTVTPVEQKIYLPIVQQQ